MIFEFMGNHPVLTVIIMLIVCGTIVDIIHELRKK